jgi:hypothetical protein
VGLGARKQTTNEQLQIARGRIKALHPKPIELGPQNPKTRRNQPTHEGNRHGRRAAPQQVLAREPHNQAPGAGTLERQEGALPWWRPDQRHTQPAGADSESAAAAGSQRGNLGLGFVAAESECGEARATIFGPGPCAA